MYVEGEQWAQKGVAKAPKLADNSFWVAGCLAMKAQTEGVLITILTDRTRAKRIEDAFTYATKAKEYRYKSETIDSIAAGHLALGLFYKKMPESMIVEFITGTRGDMDKAVKHLATGREMFPNNHELTKELGVSLICRGQRRDNPQDIENGRKYLKKVVGMPVIKPTNRVEISDSKKILEDPDLACGYSRVQQEEVSEDKLK